MSKPFTLVDRYQYVLDDFRNEGDNLELPREVCWTHCFLDREHTQEFLECMREIYPSITVNLNDLQCESKLTLVPDAIELASIDASLDRISMRIANRCESSFSIPTAVPIDKYRS